MSFQQSKLFIIQCILLLKASFYGTGTVIHISSFVRQHLSVTIPGKEMFSCAKKQIFCWGFPILCCSKWPGFCADKISSVPPSFPDLTAVGEVSTSKSVLAENQFCLSVISSHIKTHSAHKCSTQGLKSLRCQPRYTTNPWQDRICIRVRSFSWSKGWSVSWRQEGVSQQKKVYFWKKLTCGNCSLKKLFCLAQQ